MRLSLQTLPHSIPGQIQPPTAEVANVMQQLPEGQEPLLRPDGPRLAFRGWARLEPPANTYDLGPRHHHHHHLNGSGFAVWVQVGGVPGDVDGVLAVEPVTEMRG